jgi:nucleotide-binding universal stress UspA family protein
LSDVLLCLIAALNCCLEEELHHARRAFMTQTFDRRLAQLPDPGWAAPEKAIVVGVDASDRSHAALTWAITEAAVGSRPLTLLHVLDRRSVPVPVLGQESDQHGWRLLTRLEQALKANAPTVEVRKELAAGAVDTCLVAQSADQAALVVGRRGLGGFSRLLVGSTSLSVAIHARVPVVVVPEGWQVDAHATEPVVVGVDHRDLQPAALKYAFAEAHRRNVPLVAAHGREVPDLDWDSGTVAAAVDVRAEQDSTDALEHALEPWRQAYPEVKVSLLHRHDHPLTVLLDQARPTQLLVLGRHSNRRRGGFPFGSVARGVLHYAEVPVAIVPPIP